MLCGKMLVAVRAADDDPSKEKEPYWLALLSGPAFQLSEEKVQATQVFDAGFFVAPAQWFELRQTSHRAYVLLEPEVLINCHHMIRLADLEFEKGGPTRAAAASAAQKAKDKRKTKGKAKAKTAAPSLRYLHEDMHNRILNLA